MPIEPGEQYQAEILLGPVCVFAENDDGHRSLEVEQQWRDLAFLNHSKQPQGLVE